MSLRLVGTCLACALLACVLSACSAPERSDDGRAAVLSERATPVEVGPWTFQGARGWAYTTEHYRIFTTIARSIVRGRMPGFVEASLDRYLGEFPALSEPRSGLEVYVLRTRPEWRRFVIEVFGEEGLERYDAIERGGFAQGGRAVMWDMGVQDTFAILAHEGWHQFVQATFREPIPVWLDEGLAAWSEGYRWSGDRPDQPVFLPWANVERFDQLRLAHASGTLLSLEELLTQRPQDLLRESNDATLTYYAQAWALVHFLRSDPERRASLDSLLVAASSGRVGSTLRARFGARSAQAYALRRVGLDPWRVYMGEDFDAQERAFSAFVSRVVAPGSKNKIVRGESPVE